jgi:hypothetical protein
MAQTPYSTSIAAATVPEEIAINRGSAALWQSLKKLHTRASLVMVTAHPDDEDGGVLAYESRGLGARVTLLTLNRGEGGANVMSPDYFDALGLIRSEELLAADRYYGVDQYFTCVVDYAVRNADRQPSVHCFRANGMGSLSHCKASHSAGRSSAERPRPCFENHFEIACEVS